MARNGEKVRGQWTNERHVNFLNSMEASFVQSMLQKKGGNGIPPLDRYLPDTSDSTQNLDKCSKPTRSFLSSSDNVESSGSRREKKARILACQKSSQDQVVPQFQNKGDDDDKDYDKRSS